MTEEHSLYSKQFSEDLNKENNFKKFDTKSSSSGCSGITRRQFVIISCLIYNNFWTAACFSLQAPLFPKEAELKGATPTQYGMVFSVFQLVIIITSPIYGKLIPTVSPRFLVAVGVFLEGSSCAFFGLLDWIPAGTVYIVMAFLVRMLEGLGRAAFMTSCFTIVAAEFPDAVGKSFSLIEAAFGLGLIGGFTAGGALYEVGGFVLPFVVTGGLKLLGAVLILVLMPPVVDVETPKAVNMKKFFLDPGIILHALSIVTSLLFIGFNSGTLESHLKQIYVPEILEALLSRKIRDSIKHRGSSLTVTPELTESDEREKRKFGLAHIVLGTIFIISSGVYAITAPIWGWIADKGVSSYTMMVLGYFMAAVGILLIGPVPFIPFQATLWTVIGSMAIIGLGLAAKMVGAFTGALKLTAMLGFPGNLATYAVVSSLFSFSCSLGAFIGPFLGCFLLDTTGYEAGTIVVFAEEVVFLSLLLASLAWKKRKIVVDEEKTPLIRRTSGNSTIV